MSREFSFETLQLHAGQTPDKETKSRAVPIYQTTSYVFDDAQEGEDLFALRKPGNIYTRITNPTVAVLEERIAALEGGVGALATASGMAAITYAILGLAHAGDHVVAATTLYGGTFNLLKETLPRYGITTTFVYVENHEEIEAAMTGLLDPEFVEKVIGLAEVRQVYKVSKIGTIAGAYVTEGKVSRDGKVRVIRDSVVIYEGEIDTLRRFKDDVKEVQSGYECGMTVENFNDIKEGDVFEVYIMEEVKK